MADLERIVAVWTGAAGLPGVSVFYGTSGAGANADVKAFFTSLAGFFPAGMQIQVPGSGDTIDEATGSLTGVWVNSGGGGTVVAGGTGGYAAGVGLYVRWLTSGIVAGKRVTGRTFICPITSVFYESNGTISNVNLATAQSAATALVVAGNTRIWHRPSPSAPVGISFDPAAANVPDQVTSLRTRRR